MNKDTRSKLNKKKKKKKKKEEEFTFGYAKNMNFCITKNSFYLSFVTTLIIYSIVLNNHFLILSLILGGIKFAFNFTC